MKYNELIKTISEIVNNEEIFKEGLILTYELEEDNHKKMDEHLFYMANPKGTDFEHKDTVFVKFGDIKVKFIKKDLED
jgi:hypothetical protein